MIISFHPCITADTQIILGDKKLNQGHLDLIKRAKGIILPQACAFSLFNACKNSTAVLFPNYELRFSYQGKARQVDLFRRFSIPHPRTMVWNSVSDFNSFVLRNGVPHDYPFFIKRDKTHEGEGVFYIRNKGELEDVLQSLESIEKYNMELFISQDAVDCGGNVLRAVIIGKSIITYWKRSNNKDEAITTISRGAYVDSEWRPELQLKGLDMVKKFQELSGINLAAIDMVFPMKGGSPLFLEINYYFGRRGLGGSSRYYELLCNAIKEWFAAKGIDPAPVKLVI